ncbi:SusD/RagB family nutrient-binding outer membrane lipoprotein [Flavobacteriaceae bacterium AH-315-B10]|nr:SusD/RagB family nutrient-binding outer membrane lipoprotein [Flavobacteriaceae bacterium AH-315-B10]
MKKINNLIKLVLVCGMVIISSCETTNLDLTENPNALTPNQADPDFFLNAVQEDFARFVENFGRTGSQLTRIAYMAGRDYTNAYSPAGMDGRWRSAYQGMGQDLQVMNVLAEEAGLNNHIAMGEVMQAYVIMTLVDFFGPVPYTEALLGSENLNPVADSGDSVYAAAIGLLNSAIARFDDASPDPQNDFFYDGDWDNWIRAANTIKMKAYMATRLVDGSAIASFNAIVSSGNYISSSSDDFQFRWGTNEIQPDTRHPAYSATYGSTGASRYQSNSLMHYMKGKTDDGYSAPFNFDPRTLFYFYRQVSATPGIAGEPANEETLECGLILPPLHYAGFVYCGSTKGWWGRDHGNDNGIPPDGFLRALQGVYPAGGALDDLSYDSKINGDGNGGAGITPIMLASWAQFMIAEAQMVAGDVSGAKTTVFEAINTSIDKVINFAPSTDRFDWIFGTADGGPALALLSDYIFWFNLDLEADWDAGSTEDQWNILAQQYFVAMFGNGIDGYNFYRRTGYPTTLQPNIEPNPGGFIRSFLYPANYTNTNSNASQKSGVDVQVFWDTNPGSPGFPVSN